MSAVPAVAPSRRRLIATATAIAVGASVLGTAFSPYLLTHYPLLLLALSPEPRHVVLTAPLLPAWAILLVTVCRRVLGLMSLFLFGAVYGEAAIRFVERHYGPIGRMLRFMQRYLTRFGAWLVLVLPTPSVCVLAGVAGQPLGRHALAMTVGQCFWVGVTWALGDQLAQWVEPAVSFIEAHVLEATAACALLVIAWQLRSYLRARRAPPAQDEDPP